MNRNIKIQIVLSRKNFQPINSIFGSICHFGVIYDGMKQVRLLFDLGSLTTLKSFILSVTSSFWTTRIQFVFSFLFFYRNAATETVKQELKFVGQESGKLIAMREILRQVNEPSLYFVTFPHLLHDAPFLFSLGRNRLYITSRL